MWVHLKNWIRALPLENCSIFGRPLEITSMQGTPHLGFTTIVSLMQITWTPLLELCGSYLWNSTRFSFRNCGAWGPPFRKGCNWPTFGNSSVWDPLLEFVVLGANLLVVRTWGTSFMNYNAGQSTDIVVDRAWNWGLWNHLDFIILKISSGC